MTQPTETAPLLEIKTLTKHFPVYRQGLVRREIGRVRAVDNVSFNLYPGETLGLVGESGCGKTTTGRTILRALTPSSGEVWFNSADTRTNLAGLESKQLKPLRRQMQMIFQDPFSSLNPRMTIGDIVGEPLRIHRMARGAVLRAQVAEMLHRVGLNPEHASRYPHAFSGGQRQRVGIARALVMRPQLVIADEAVSALDVSVQAQIINLLEELQTEFNLTLLFIAHDISVVRHMCDRIAVMYAGKIVELAKTDELFENPCHPYTRLLLSAVPLPDPDKKMHFPAKGQVVDLSRLPTGCAFHPRCIHCKENCRTYTPDLYDHEGRQVACHLYAEQDQF